MVRLEDAHVPLGVFQATLGIAVAQMLEEAFWVGIETCGAWQTGRIPWTETKLQPCSLQAH